MPSEYELAAQRLEMLDRIRAYDENQKKLENLQQQLSYFEDAKIHSLLQLPVIRNNDRSPVALEELKTHLCAFKTPFFKTLLEKLKIKNADTIFDEVKKEVTENYLMLDKLAKQQFIEGSTDYQFYLNYINECSQHFSYYADLIFQQAQAQNPDIGVFRTILADFDKACVREKEKLSALSSNPLSWVDDTEISPASPRNLILLYNLVISNKKEEISCNEMLNHFAESCEAEKLKIIDAITQCQEKNRECERLQSELKAFDDMYFDHPNIASVMPRDQLWKLGVDAKSHRYGRLVYDRGLHGGTAEPGYTDGMETALAFVLRSVGADLSADFIAQVHRIACYFLRDKPNMSDPFYKDTPYDLPVELSFLSLEGIREVAQWNIWNRWTTLTPDNISEFLEKLKVACEDGRKIHVGRRGDAEVYVKGYIQQYHQWMNEAGDDNRQKMLAIAKFCRLIDCSHPFPDGNIRTARLLMLKLMIENNLMPTMMMDPNMLDTYHSNEVVNAMKEGQHTYELECLLASVDKPGSKEKLKSKIIDQCEERHGLFIANNVKKLRELFPEYVELINARFECVKEKTQSFYLSYCDPMVQKRFEEKVQFVFEQHTNTAVCDKTLTSTSQTLFGQGAKSRGEPSTHLDQTDLEKKAGPTQ